MYISIKQTILFQVTATTLFPLIRWTVIDKKTNACDSVYNKNCGVIL